MKTDKNIANAKDNMKPNNNLDIVYDVIATTEVAKYRPPVHIMSSLSVEDLVNQ